MEKFPAPCARRWEFSQSPKIIWEDAGTQEGGSEYSVFSTEFRFAMGQKSGVRAEILEGTGLSPLRCEGWAAGNGEFAWRTLAYGRPAGMP